MKNLVLPLLFVSVLALHAQDVEVIQQFDTTRQSPLHAFVYLEEATDPATLIHKATIQVSANTKSGGMHTLLFLQAKIFAGKLNANSYRILEFSNQDDGIRLVLDLYYADEAALAFNASHQPHNAVFVFGSDSPGKIVRCRVNDLKIELQPFTFYKQENKPGQEIKVSKGGITGMAVWVRWEQNKPARYVTLSGFGISGGGVSPAGGGAIGFNTGRLAYLDGELGRFLALVMKPAPDLKK